MNVLSNGQTSVSRSNDDEIKNIVDEGIKEVLIEKKIYGATEDYIKSKFIESVSAALGIVDEKVIHNLPQKFLYNL